MTGDGRAAPPIVVLLGGPSAEHDVSIVSGTAIADALAAAGIARRRRSSSTSTARWWWLPADHVAATGRQPPTTTRRRSAPTARSSAGRRDRPAGRPRPGARRRSSRCTGRSARTARSRRCSRRPAWPTPGSGVAASALGMDKALFKRMCRGLGLPVVDWREVRAARWATDPRRGPGRARGVRRRRGATRA